jgi:KDO2-lipid IV(A) lauroyltransferase
MSRWKSFRYRLEYAACRLVAAAIPRLSRRACFRLANGLAAVAYALDGRGRRIAVANLECVFGDRYTPAQRVEIARASYRNFARTMLDLFWARRLTQDNHAEWIRVDGQEAMRARILREKGGPVFVCGHFGNWEWSNFAAGYHGYKPVTVAENFKNPLLTEIFKSLREHNGATLIPQENSLLRMLKTVKRKGPASLVIDLNLPPTQAATVIEAFRDDTKGLPGFKMCVPILHAVLAQRGGAVLIPAETRPQPDGTCVVIAHPAVEVAPSDSLNSIAQKCWNVFEAAIHERPDLYLWGYQHFRYRPVNAGRPYPFYSNENKKFEKLMREEAKAAAELGSRGDAESQSGKG